MLLAPTQRAQRCHWPDRNRGALTSIVVPQSLSRKNRGERIAPLQAQRSSCGQMAVSTAKTVANLSIAAKNRTRPLALQLGSKVGRRMLKPCAGALGRRRPPGPCVSPLEGRSITVVGELRRSEGPRGRPDAFFILYLHLLLPPPFSCSLRGLIVAGRRLGGVGGFDRGWSRRGSFHSSLHQ